MKPLLFSFCIALLISCSKETSINPQKADLNLVDSLSLNIPDSVLLGYTFWFVTNPNSTKFATFDMIQQKVAVFNFDGSFINSFGKRGSGPGEFQQILGISISENDEILVYDESLDKIEIFNLEGKLILSLRGIKELNLFEASNFLLLDKGNIYVPTISMDHRFEPWNTHLITKFDTSRSNFEHIGKYSEKINDANHSDYSPIYNYDVKNNSFYVTYTSTPIIEKFGFDGTKDTSFFNPSNNIRKLNRKISPSTSREETLKNLNLVSTPRSIFVTKDYLIYYFFNKNENEADNLFLSVFDLNDYSYLGDLKMASPPKFSEHNSNRLFFEKAVNSDPYTLYIYEIFEKN